MENGDFFSKIIEYVSVNEIKTLYSPYHEMDTCHFVYKMNELYINAKLEANLKIYRKRDSLRQKMLAEQADIPVRMIQYYEQRQKNINKAQVESL